MSEALAASLNTTPTLAVCVVFFVAACLLAAAYYTGMAVCARRIRRSLDTQLTELVQAAEEAAACAHGMHSALTEAHDALATLGRSMGNVGAAARPIQQITRALH